MWNNWNDKKPEPGQKITYLYDDGCGGGAGLVIDFDGAGTIRVLDAEDGYELPEESLNNSLWALVPDNYALAFMEADDRP